MASQDPTVLTKDVWTKVLSNVTYTGQVFVLDQDEEPTSYLVAFVNYVASGTAPPAVDFAGGIKVEESFSPSNSVASDYYMMPTDYDGLVEILV